MEEFFNSNLEYLMSRYSFSQSALANTLNVSRSTVNGWVNEHKTPNVELIGLISKHFFLTVDSILYKDLRKEHLINLQLQEIDHTHARYEDIIQISGMPVSKIATYCKFRRVMCQDFARAYKRIADPHYYEIRISNREKHLDKLDEKEKATLFRNRTAKKNDIQKLGGIPLMAAILMTDNFHKPLEGNSKRLREILELIQRSTNKPEQPLLKATTLYCMEHLLKMEGYKLVKRNQLVYWEKPI